MNIRRHSSKTPPNTSHTASVQLLKLRYYTVTTTTITIKILRIIIGSSLYVNFFITISSRIQYCYCAKLTSGNIQSSLCFDQSASTLFLKTFMSVGSTIQASKLLYKHLCRSAQLYRLVNYYINIYVGRLNYTG